MSATRPGGVGRKLTGRVLVERGELDEPGVSRHVLVVERGEPSGPLYERFELPLDVGVTADGSVCACPSRRRGRRLAGEESLRSVVLALVEWIFTESSLTLTLSDDPCVSVLPGAEVDPWP